MGTIIIFLMLLITPAYAECPVNATEDTMYTDGDVTYSCPSQATLKARADAQAIIDAQTAKDEQIKALQAQISELATQMMNALADDNDDLVTTLKAQRNAIKSQLQTLKGE